MKGKKTNMKLAALGIALIAPGAVFAQNIAVVVNGDPVVFSGMGPRQVNGRVLVPLRGVMEKMGAYVGWDPSTKTVTASLKPGLRPPPSPAIAPCRSRNR